MTTQPFLVELGCEELPPKSLKILAESFLAGIEAGLKQAGLAYEGARYYAAPRRLAVHIDSLALQQPDRVLTVDGPPVKAAFDANGNPTQAALGFAKKNGIDISEVDRSGEKLRYSRQVKGESATALITTIINQSLAQLPIAKRMRWGANKVEFVRPVQWLVMLLGGDIVDGEVLGFKAGRVSRGHRFHAPAPITLNHANDYLAALKEAYVIADFAERQVSILQQVTDLATKENGKALIPAALLDEVTGLVEYPVPLVCSFEERFLHVPQEALISTMQDNQKYFCLVDAKGKLLPRFITVANIQSSNPKFIVEGNEKVVRPRLTDAEFFFKQDQKTKLETRNERLKTVVFQAQLGTVYEKAERISELAAFIAAQIGGDVALAQRAGILSKCDLATEMVGEFPELQGIAGYYYAQHDGEGEEVALSLNEQYLPKFSGDVLPSTATGLAVAIADKLDTLVGIFGINQPPTGSKDPYALRRATIGVLRILIEKQLNISIHDVITKAAELYGNKLSIVPTELSITLNKFLLERLRARYEDLGVDYKIFNAVLPTGAVIALRPFDFHKRVLAVQEFLTLPEARELVEANKRVVNLLKSHGQFVLPNDDKSLYKEKAEHDLGAALDVAFCEAHVLYQQNDYVGSLLRMSALHKEVKQFLDGVFVNVDDLAVRNNRYSLLERLREAFVVIADISQLQ